MRWRALIFLAVAWLGPAAGAGAQATVGQTVVSFGGPSPAGRVLSSVDLPARAVGEVGVSFGPDQGTGCAALAACAYTGSYAWTPGGGGGLELTRSRVHGRIRHEADLLLGEGAVGPGSLTASRVNRLPGGSCTDEQPGVTRMTAVSHGDSVTFSVAQVLAATRCAGPLPDDLADAAPAVTISTAALARGDVTLDFRGQRRFAAHGFSGTVTSSLVVFLGKAMRPPLLLGSGAGPGARTRFVTEAMTVSSEAGSLTGAVTGTANPNVCVLLDSCGLKGTLTIAPKPAGGQGALVAYGPAARPYVDFLTALGLSRAGHARGIGVVGSVTWRDGGTVAASMHQTSDCTDTAPLDEGSAFIALGARRVSVSYTVGSSPGGGAALRTRCPGPLLLSAAAIASGSVPRTALRHRRFTVELKPGRSLDDEGYSTSFGGRVRLGFRLGRVTQEVVSLPAG